MINWPLACNPKPRHLQSFSSQGKALSQQRAHDEIIDAVACAMAPNTRNGAAARCAASDGQRLVASLCASPTARCRPLYEGAAAAQATRPARATAPFKRETYLRGNRCSLGLHYGPTLQPSAPRRSLQASSRAASRLRAKTPCEAQARATAPVERSDALGSSWRSCNFHKRFWNST